LECSPQYYEIWKYGEVKGISLLFMTIDLLGGVFSVLSLVFKEHFDVLGGVAYSAVVVGTTRISCLPLPFVLLRWVLHEVKGRLFQP
jgi:hypothetical protein